MIKRLKLFSTKIETWAEPITMRAYDEHDSVGLTRALFKVPTDVKIVATEEKVNKSEMPGM